MDGLEQLFPLPTGREKYTDSDIRKISALLRGVNLKWSRVPRIYIVLRTIGALHVLDAFISLGYSDYWLPFNPRTLPDITGASMRDSFIEKQPIVLTKSIDLEKGENGKHQYYAKGEPIPFKTVRYLGSGGYGKVDKVVSSLSHKEYARKRIPRWGFFQRSKANVDSFEIELQLLKRLSHRHIIELVGSYTDPTYLGLMISPVADYDLACLLDRAPTSSDQKLLLRTYFGCLSTAVAYLHDNKVRHKDIKPQNVLIKGKTAFLTDFGISRDWTEMSRSTTQGTTFFTPQYCAPEVANHGSRNTSSDIWSLGCLFLEIVAVLKDRTRSAMNTFFQTHGSKTVIFWNNSSAVSQWIAMLRGSEESELDNIPLEWVQEMLHHDPAKRLDANTLVYTIMSSGSDSGSITTFCGTCCTEHEELTDGSEAYVDGPSEALDTTLPRVNSGFPSPRSSIDQSDIPLREAVHTSQRIQPVSTLYKAVGQEEVTARPASAHEIQPASTPRPKSSTGEPRKSLSLEDTTAKPTRSTRPPSINTVRLRAVEHGEKGRKGELDAAEDHSRDPRQGPSSPEPSKNGDQENGWDMYVSTTYFCILALGNVLM
jgi:serine/threonine protein kinase